MYESTWHLKLCGTFHHYVVVQGSAEHCLARWIVANVNIFTDQCKKVIGRNGGLSSHHLCEVTMSHIQEYSRSFTGNNFFFCLVRSCTDIKMSLCWSVKRSTFAIINIVLFVLISCMHWCNHARRVDCGFSFGSLTTTMLIETQCSVLVIICISQVHVAANAPTVTDLMQVLARRGSHSCVSESSQIIDKRCG